MKRLLFAVLDFDAATRLEGVPAHLVPDDVRALRKPRYQAASASGRSWPWLSAFRMPPS
jgi:hypothetical protein